MKHFSLAMALCLLPGAAMAQLRGFSVDGGVAVLTKSGSLDLGTSTIQSDAGYALRGRLRYGLGFVSFAADVQDSRHDYPSPLPNGAPTNLNATFLGVTGAVHPFSFAGIVPYGEVGIGKLFFADQSINTDQGSTASSYGLGVLFGSNSRFGIDVELRLIRLTNLTAQGVVGDFTYDPKEFSVMLSLKL